MFIRRRVTMPTTHTLSSKKRTLSGLVHNGNRIKRFNRVTFPLNLNVNLRRLRRGVTFTHNLRRHATVVNTANIRVFNAIVRLNLPTNINVFLRSFSLKSFQLILKRKFIYSNLLRSVSRYQVPLPCSVSHVVRTNTTNASRNATGNVQRHRGAIHRAKRNTGVLARHRVRIAISSFNNRLGHSNYTR